MSRLLLRRGTTKPAPTAVSAFRVEEPWPGINGAVWPTGWQGVGTFGRTQQDGKGRILNPGTSYGYGGAWMTQAAGIIGDFDLTTTVSPVADCWWIVGMASAYNDWTLPLGGYTFRATVNASGVITELVLNKRVQGSSTTALAYAYPSLPAGVINNVRIQRSGTTVRAKMWQGATEPGTWNVSATDATPLEVTLKPWLTFESYGADVDFGKVTVA